MLRIYYLVTILLLSISLFVQSAEVTVSGTQILVNGTPYIIRGVCYNPVEVGQTDRSFDRLNEDLALMQEASINTIRIYSPIDDKAVLDAIAAAGIKVIVSFGYNQNGYYDIFSGTYLEYIDKYMDHDAILLWEFGNEYNYHPEWFDNDIANWYTALNDAAQEAKNKDWNHPTATAHGELPDITARTMCSEVDVWGLNVYRWDNPSEIFAEWQNVSTKPMFLSEAGADSYMTAAGSGYAEGENPTAQADATGNILDAVFNAQDICSGVCLFSFTDEWWKAGDPSIQDVGGWAPNSSGVPYDGAPNEEYWGILEVDRTKKEAFEVVKAKYQGLVSLEEEAVQIPSVKLYPNPVMDQLTLINLPKYYDSIEITDVFGRTFKKIKVADNSASMDVGFLNRGIYCITINKDDKLVTLRFSKM